MPKIHHALFLLFEQRVQPPWLGLRTFRTQEGDHAERRLRTCVDDEYRQVVCYRKRRRFGYRNFAHLHLHVQVAFEPTSRQRPESQRYLLRFRSRKRCARQPRLRQP